MVTILLPCSCTTAAENSDNQIFGMMLLLLSLGLNHMQQKTYFKTLPKSDKRTGLKDSDSERLEDGIDQLHTSANTEAKLIIFLPNQMYTATATTVSTYDLYNFA